MAFSPSPSGLLWIVQLSERLNVLASNHVKAWPLLDKEGLGDQLIRAIDSIGLNISEGYARTHKKERLHFFQYAEGSIEEALFAIRRARDRGLLTKLDAYTLSNLLMKMSPALNAFKEFVMHRQSPNPSLLK